LPQQIYDFRFTNADCRLWPCHAEGEKSKIENPKS